MTRTLRAVIAGAIALALAPLAAPASAQVPYTFSNQKGVVSASQLDANFAAVSAPQKAVLASAYPTLAAADVGAQAKGAGGFIILDKSFTLTANTTITSPLQPNGGLITCGSNTLTLGKVSGLPIQMFNCASGLVTIANPGGAWAPHLAWFGAKTDVVRFTDCATTAGSAQISLPSESLSAADVGKYLLCAGGGPAVAAVDYLDFFALPVANDSFTLNGTTVTFVASGATSGQLNIDTTPAAMAADVVSYINANSVTFGVTAAILAEPGVTGSARVGLTANTPGPSGNSLTLTATAGGIATTVFNGSRVGIGHNTFYRGAASSPLYGTITAASAHTATLAPTNGCSIAACFTVSGAEGSYGSDSAASLNSAFNDGASFIGLDGASYGLASAVTVPKGVSVVGQGVNTQLVAFAPIIMLTDESPNSGGFGVRYKRIESIFADGQGIATECFRWGAHIVKDYYNSLSANNCRKGFVLDGTQNSHFVQLEANGTLEEAINILNGSGNNYINDGEFSGSTIRNIRFAVDTSKPAWNLQYFGNGFPQQNHIVGGVEENGTAPIGVEIAQGWYNSLEHLTMCDMSNASAVVLMSPNLFIGGGNIQNEILRPFFCAGSFRNGGMAVVNMGFKTSWANGGTLGPGYGSGTNVVKNYNQLVFSGSFPDFTSQNYKMSNNSGNAPSNFTMGIGPVYIGSGNISTYTGIALPGMFAFNDAGNLWLFGKTAWAQAVVISPQNFAGYTATAATPQLVSNVATLPAPGVYNVVVTAENGDDNQALISSYQVGYTNAPSGGPYCAVSPAYGTLNWGSQVTAQSLSCSTSGQLSVTVTTSVSTSGHVRLTFTNVGVAASTG